ncbi:MULTISPECIES: hypothetical protein [Pseudomonas]|jgi:hypothetical protein|nr:MULTISPECIES: hypothetical protein [Pseudomonas]MDC7827820.1 hypothetical protein [Pseudomonas benzopyrenica]
MRILVADSGHIHHIFNASTPGLEGHAGRAFAGASESGEDWAGRCFS